MARDLIKLPNNKWGFLILIALEALVAVWALVATYHSIQIGRTRTVLYGAVVLFAVFYILGRSLRTFAGLLKQERAEKQGSEGEKK